MQGRSSGPQDTALLVEAVNQLEDRLINQLQNHTLELRHGFEGVHQRLDDLSVTLGRQIQKVLEDNAALKNMVQTLIAGTHDIPTLAIVLPEVSPSWESVTHPMRLLRNHFRLYFLCSHTKQIAPCGPEGKGYKIEVTKKWVQDAAPVLRVGLVLVKAALIASCIPLPVPDLCSALADKSTHNKYLDAALHLIADPPDDHDSPGEFAMESSLDAVEAYGVNNLLSDGVRPQLQEGSMDAYEIIRTVLVDHHHDIVLNSGLQKVTCTHTGRTAWVLKDAATEQAWREAVARDEPHPEPEPLDDADKAEEGTTAGTTPTSRRDEPVAPPANDNGSAKASSSSGDSATCCGCCVS
jgi:hypothetical protein